MTWENSRRTYKEDIKTLKNRLAGDRKSLIPEKWPEIKPLIAEIGAEDMAEIIMMIYHLVVHQDRDLEWIQQAFDRQEKLERRNWDAGRPSKVEHFTRHIKNAYQNDDQYEGDYWKVVWNDAKTECGRSTLWRVRRRLREEHGMMVDEPHGNSDRLLEEVSMVELENYSE